MNYRYQKLIQMLKSSKKIIDLGCGNNPVPGACVAVDNFIEPEQRCLGYGPKIDLEKFKRLGIKFVNQRIDSPLPFENKEFDFAYSSHSFEHLENPDIACKEMMRIAKAGVIITPSIFAEIAFGRPYHKFLVIERGNTIFFFEKRSEEDRPFGEHPLFDTKKGYISTDETNPFDIALNDGEWYKNPIGTEFNKLRQKLKYYWLTHSSIIEIIFIWYGSFNFLVVKDKF